MMNLTNTSDWLAQQISEIVDAKGKIKFALLGDNLGGKGLPLVAWNLKEKEDYDGASISASLVPRP
jgi:glutamate decarboxylase